ncbi:hypothetical protein [Staphylococcus agnetis]|uniref:hypothetical protein n=1 Tax=Staphylococcus agnetis TaxID=985762 RepID=UPI0014308CCD|nr:hypothetical protein [Staphylococcus agnetis]NJH68457.1 hypothetical protein [Staphylococcus agnetis]
MEFIDQKNQHIKLRYCKPNDQPTGDHVLGLGLGHRVSASKKNTTKITSKDFVVFFHLNST